MGPVRLPFVGCGVPVPAPSTELWDILLDRGCLIPVEVGLQQCPFNVLNQCSLGGRQVLKGLGTIWKKPASSTRLEPQLLLYMITTIRSSLLTWTSNFICSGSKVMATRVSVSSGVASQAAHALLFPYPKKADVVSHPVSA